MNRIIGLLVALAAVFGSNAITWSDLNGKALELQYALANGQKIIVPGETLYLNKKGIYNWSCMQNNGASYGPTSVSGNTITLTDKETHAVTRLTITNYDSTSKLLTTQDGHGLVRVFKVAKELDWPDLLGTTLYLQYWERGGQRGTVQGEKLIINEGLIGYNFAWTGMENDGVSAGMGTSLWRVFRFTDIATGKENYLSIIGQDTTKGLLYTEDKYNLVRVFKYK